MIEERDIFEQYDYLKPLHRELKRIVQEFDSLCGELNISYYIGYGTLLGAVRHGDIIPWDDDIDLLMPRHDYEILIQYFKNNKDLRYELLCPELSDDCYVLFGKFISNNSNPELKKYFIKDRGLSIDIFPLDNCLDDSNLLQKITNLRITFLSRAIYSKSIIKNGDKVEQSSVKRIIRRLFVAPFYLFSQRTLLNHTLSIMKKKMNSSTNRMINYGIRYKHSIVNFDKGIFEGTGKMSMGDGFSFYAPLRYNDFLVQVYGKSYMEIPKEKDRYYHNH